MEKILINLFEKFNLDKNEFIEMAKEETDEDYGGTGSNFEVIKTWIENKLLPNNQDKIKFSDYSEYNYESTYLYFLTYGYYNKVAIFRGYSGSCTGCGSDYKIDDLVEMLEKCIFFNLEDLDKLGFINGNE